MSEYSRIVTKGRNEILRKAYQDDDGGWIGYELVEYVEKDGRLYPTSNGESHHSFQAEKEAKDWVHALD